MKKQYMRSILAAGLMLIVVLDTKTAAAGVRTGVTVCLETVIPSLFPFIVISKYISAGMVGHKIGILSSVAKLCGIPDKLESILGIGLIAGYPVGAQAVADAYAQGQISRKCANRLLGFCNNAGPAFIFGMAASLFPHSKAGWVTWLIQILSALYVGIILPGQADTLEGKYRENTASITTALETGVHSMAVICGWIVLFRVFLSYLDRYFVIPNAIVKSAVIGFLDLSNGCLSLSNVSFLSCRFVLLNAMLSCGGICVWMQTGSVTKELSQKWFYIGKALQCLFSIFTAAFFQPFLFGEEVLKHRGLILICSLIFLLIGTFLFTRKKVVALFGKILYNNRKKQEMRFAHVIPQEN